MLLIRSMAMMMGIRNWAIDCYIPLEQLKADCEDSFGDLCDVESLFSDADAALNENKHQKVADGIYSFVEDASEEQAEYDIVLMNEMVFWEPDDEAAPDLTDKLEAFLSSAYKATESNRKEFFQSTRAERLKAITAWGGKRYLLSEERWKEIFSDIMDDMKMARYITLFCAESNEKMSNILLHNDALYNEVWRRVSDAYSN